MKTDLATIPAGDDKNAAFDRILRFYTHSDISLTAADEKIHCRWIYCDARIRERKYREKDIVQQLVDLYGISKRTATNDYYFTQALFANARRFNRKYFLVQHAENIALKIAQYETDKSLSHLLPKMYDSYTKALMAIPEDMKAAVLSPPVFIFQAAAGQEVTKPMTMEEARAKARLKLNPAAAEDIDHEDVPK